MKKFVNVVTETLKKIGWERIAKRVRKCESEFGREGPFVPLAYLIRNVGCEAGWNIIL
ncbi:MAG: hypothetical protein ACTS43_00490 [Candidatus Hodgkinia cicadicola]